MYDIIKSQLYQHVKAEQEDSILNSCEDYMNFTYRFEFEDGEVSSFAADTTIPVLIFTSEVDYSNKSNSFLNLSRISLSSISEGLLSSQYIFSIG